jgi:hypothetical protein
MKKAEQEQDYENTKAVQEKHMRESAKIFILKRE